MGQTYGKADPEDGRGSIEERRTSAGTSGEE
jgi:hypothetical protein